MKKQIRISDWCSLLPISYYSDLIVENHTDLQPSPERIRRIAISKLENQAVHESEVPAVESALRKENTMKKKNILRIFMIAAAVCLISITAVAASIGGLPYFKAIFGGGADTVQEDIRNPELTAANQDYKMSIQGLLSDGYKTHVIVSVESLKDAKLTEDPSGLFSVQCKASTGEISPSLNAVSCEALSPFSKGKINFYNIQVGSLKSQLDSTMEVVFQKGAPLKIDIPVKHSTASKTVKINGNSYRDKNYRPESVQLSPLGVLVIGSEGKAKGGLPTSNMFVLMKDGTKDELISPESFDTGDGEPVKGGGGAVEPGFGQPTPLVTQTMGERNPDGKVVTTGYFSRILDLSQVKSILVDGTEYPVG